MSDATIITLPYDSTEEAATAAALIAQLLREGIRYTVEFNEATGSKHLVVRMTGF